MGYHIEKKPLILEEIVEEAFAETCLRGFWDKDEFFKQNREDGSIPVDVTECSPKSPISSFGNQQMVVIRGAPPYKRPQKLALLRADLTRDLQRTSSSDLRLQWPS